MASSSQAEADNTPRWREACRRKGHVESWFLKWNLPDPAEGPFAAFWLKFTILQPRGESEAVGEVWAMAFRRGGGEHVALKETVPLGRCIIAPHGLDLGIGSSVLRHSHSEGVLANDDHTVRWAIDWAPDPQGLRPLPYAWMYRGRFPKNKLTSPQPDARMRGYVEVDGERIAIEDAPGLQGHNWGPSHPPEWLWTHCNIWSARKPAIFEAVTSRIALGPILSPPISVLTLRYDGDLLLWNRPLQLLRTQSSLEGWRWRLEARGHHYRVQAEIWAEPDDFVGVNYHNPDGGLVHCLNSKVASGELRLFERGHGRETLLEHMVATSSAAFEIGTAKGTRGIPILIE